MTLPARGGPTFSSMKNIPPTLRDGPAGPYPPGRIRPRAKPRSVAVLFRCPQGHAAGGHITGRAEIPSDNEAVVVGGEGRDHDAIHAPAHGRP